MKVTLKSLKTALVLSLVVNGDVHAKSKKQEPAKQEAKVTRQKKTSGLEYEILTAAPAGAQSPQKGQIVSVHYTGWLDENGTPSKKAFDSSVTRGKQFEFRLGAGQVIAGWDEAVADMKIGEKRRVYIPSTLAYGIRGVPGVIPGSAKLIFDIELFSAK